MKPNKHRRPHEPAWEPMGNASFPNGDPNEGDPSYVGTFKNHLYQVLMREYSYDDSGAKYQWLVIRRLDAEAVHDWRHFQRIKNELCGPECEAIEIYPAESRLVDASNQYHLFVMPPGFKFPFGYNERDVSDQMLPQSGVLKQRPFDIKPPDLNTRDRNNLTTKVFGGHSGDEP